MKKAANAVKVLALLPLFALFCACGSIFEAEYSWAEPYSEELYYEVDPESIEIKSYTQLKTELLNMISSAEESASFRFSGYNGPVSDDIASACYEVANQTPLGSYAAKSIDYDINRIVSYYTADVSISYKRSAEEISSVINANGVTEFCSRVHESIDNLSDSVTIKVYSSTINEEYIKNYVNRILLEEDLFFPCTISVSVQSYPSVGSNKIYELGFDYGSETELIPQQREQTRRAVSEAAEALRLSSPENRYVLTAAQYVSGLVTENTGVYSSSAYGVFVEGRADSMGCALAYKALLDELSPESECLVVVGSTGASAGELHFWNIVRIDDDYYHVDVSAMSAKGLSGSFLLSDKDIWGEYIWDGESYPACSGEKTYLDFVDYRRESLHGSDEGLPPEEPGDTALPAETEQPEPMENTEDDKKPVQM